MAKLIMKLEDDREVFSCDVLSVIKGVDIEKRILHITGTDETRDRDGDILTVKGWNLDNYRKNPVFLWAHDYSSVPLGRTMELKIRRDPARVDFKIQFPSKGLYPFADMILDLYGERVINASSVGFIPYKWEDIIPKEGEEDMHRGRGRKYTDKELLELSGCAVPSNPAALQNAMKAAQKYFSNTMPGDLLEILKTGKPPEPLKIDDVLGELYVHQPFVLDEKKNIFVVPSSFTVKTEELVEEVEDDEGWGIEEKKIEETENEVRYRVKDPARFDPDSFRTVPIKRDKPRVNSIMGKIKGGTEMVIQALRFPKEDGWDIPKATAWIKEHANLAKQAEADLVSHLLNLYESLGEDLFALRVEHEDLTVQESDRESALKEAITARNVMQATAVALEEKFGFTAGEISYKREEDGSITVHLPEGREFEQKAGAVLNRKNKERLTAAQKSIQEVLDEATSAQESSDDTQGLAGANGSSTGKEGGDLYEEILDGKGDKPEPSLPKEIVQGLSSAISNLSEIAKMIKASC